MRIVVNDIAASSGGALTILKSFYEYVKENDNENEYIFILSASYIEETKNIKVIIEPNVKKGWLHKLWFDFVYGHNLINRLNPDYVLSLQNTMTFRVNCKQGIYVHQSIPFQNAKEFSFLKKSERYYAIYQYLIGWVIKLSVKNCDDIYVQTNWMKKAVEDKTGVEADKISVVPYMPKIDFDSCNSICYEDNSFIYPAASENVYKNHYCLYEACRILENKNLTNFKVNLTLDNSQLKKPYIINVGFLDKTSLYNYYRKSVLVFPSFIETIGLPLLEVRSINGIIFAANCEYAREVLDGYNNVYFFNPHKPNELADLMEMFITGNIVLKKENNYENLRNEDNWSIILKKILGN